MEKMITAAIILTTTITNANSHDSYNKSELSSHWEKHKSINRKITNFQRGNSIYFFKPFQRSYRLHNKTVIVPTNGTGYFTYTRKIHGPKHYYINYPKKSYKHRQMKGHTWSSHYDRIHFSNRKKW